MTTEETNFDSDQWDSDDEVANADDFASQRKAVSLELSKAADKTNKALAKKDKKTNDIAARAAATRSRESSVMYIGHIPHGFYESQMKGFFSQFGDVKQLRLSRSKKTNRSRGYAFVEFDDIEVAKIVVETMNGYMLFDHTLVCKIVPPEKIHERMFANSDRYKHFDHKKRAASERERHNQKKTPAQQKKNVKNLLSREKKKRKQLEKLGIDYDFDGYEKAKEGKEDKVVNAELAPVQKRKQLKEKLAPKKAKKTKLIK